jgi:hypothetical protein
MNDPAGAIRTCPIPTYALAAGGPMHPAREPGTPHRETAGCALPASGGYAQIEVTPGRESGTAVFAGKVG